MLKLTDRELAQIGAEKTVGACFETDLLDTDIAHFEVVGLLPGGAMVKRLGTRPIAGSRRKPAA